MTARAALAGLHAALRLDAAHVLVTGVGAAAPAPLPPDADSATPRPATPRPATAHPQPVVRRPPGPIGTSPVTTLIRRLLAEALHRAPQDIGDDEQFLTLGLDSLSAVDLARRLERELDRPLPATLLFEHRTIGELATHLATTTPPTPMPTAIETPTPMPTSSVVPNDPSSTATADDRPPLPLPSPPPTRLPHHRNPPRGHHRLRLRTPERQRPPRHRPPGPGTRPPRRPPPHAADADHRRR